MFILIIARRN